MRHVMHSCSLFVLVCSAILVISPATSSFCATALEAPASGPGTDQKQPPDIKDHPQRIEMMKALELGYMSLPDGSSFKPDGTIKAMDFVSCLGRVLKSRGSGVPEIRLDAPAEPISRQQAAKIMVECALSPEQISSIRAKCGKTDLYLSDFEDADQVGEWARDHVAAAVYSGWLPGDPTLQPKAPATRAYVAVLLARAFPQPKSYTGLVVCVQDAGFARASTVEIVSDGGAGQTEALYPCKANMPSMAFFGAPGMVTYYESVEATKAGRVGDSPLVLDTTVTRKGQGGKTQIVLSPESAKLLQDADDEGLFLRSWRVAIVAPRKLSAK